MCLIIVRRKGTKPVDKDDLTTAIENNPHGWGVSYIGENKLEVIKSLDMKVAESTLRALEEEDKEFIFHVRYATKGSKDTDNCHPIPIKGVGVLFHNGTMTKAGEWMAGKSDTFHLATRIEKRVEKTGKSIYDLLDAYDEVIDGSRIAIMTDDGQIIIAGKVENKYNGWNEIEGNLYSNRYAMEDKSFHYAHGATARNGYTTSFELSKDLKDGKLITLKDLRPLAVMGYTRMMEQHTDVMVNLIMTGISSGEYILCDICESNELVCEECGECDLCSVCYCDEDEDEEVSEPLLLLESELESKEENNEIRF